jgi:signal transduction histidine kinase
VRDITERKTLEKKLFETIINTEEKEREKFAGDLHDEVGPLLSSLKMYISLLAETDDKKKKEYITPQIQTLIKEAITSVREISNDLSPHVLNNYGCVAAINSFIGMKRDFINVAFNQNLENVRFAQSIEIVLYRVVKELVNNTIKHAKAFNIEIKMYEEDNFIKLFYKDDGIGFKTDETVNLSSGSIGLLNIMSRVKTVNGKYKISSSKGTGFAFEMTIPLK